VLSKSAGVKSKFAAALGFSAATVCDALLRLTQNSAVSKFNVLLGFGQVPFTHGTSGIGPTLLPPVPALPPFAVPPLELPAPGMPLVPALPETPP
jgi:hypothetical protein